MARSGRPWSRYCCAKACASRALCGRTAARRAYDHCASFRYALPSRNTAFVVGRLECGEAPILVDHADGVARLFVRCRQLKVCGCLRWHETDGPLQAGDRIARATQRHQAAAGQEVRGTKRRVECNRGAEFDEGFGVAPPLLQHDAEIVMDERAIPARGEHIAKRAFSAIEVAALSASTPSAKRSASRDGRSCASPVVAARVEIRRAKPRRDRTPIGR